MLLIISAFLLVCAGVYPASASILPAQAQCHAIIRVDSCHPMIHQAKTSPCCQSLACHQQLPIQRDLGRPEYQTRHKESHPLLQESRPLTPQFKVGEIFRQPYSQQATQHSGSYRPDAPLQSLISLRSVILLH